MECLGPGDIYLDPQELTVGLKFHLPRADEIIFDSYENASISSRTVTALYLIAIQLCWCSYVLSEEAFSANDNIWPEGVNLHTQTVSIADYTAAVDIEDF